MTQSKNIIGTGSYMYITPAGEKGAVEVALACPKPFDSEEGDYYCEFSIMGDGISVHERAGGVDALQALYQAFVGINLELKKYEAQCGVTFEKGYEMNSPWGREVLGDQ